MDYSYKKINIFIVVLLVLVFFNQPQVSPPTKNLDDIPQPIIENTKISKRKIAIQNTMEHPDKLRTTKINGETYLLTGYSETHYTNDDNKPGRKFGGILVFKLVNNEPVLFWESEDYINSPYVSFLDIDNDGIDEIVWDGDLGVTGRSNAFYVYKFTGDKFKIITPIEIQESTVSSIKIKYGWTLLAGSSELSYIKDIDDDKVLEIIVGSRDENEKALVFIYKFNGSEYYLWKEVTESSPEFKKLFK